MKIIFLYNLIFAMITNDVPLNLLGKHINEIPNTYCNSTGNSLNGRICTIDVSEEFLGKQYDMVFIGVDKDGIIQNFTIYIDEIIDKPFYDRLVRKYDDPTLMYKRKEPDIKEKFKGEFIMESKILDIEKCTFEEFPLFIIWNKKDYDIEIIIGNKNDTFKKTRIIFGKGPLSNSLKI